MESFVCLRHSTPGLLAVLCVALALMFSSVSAWSAAFDPHAEAGPPSPATDLFDAKEPYADARARYQARREFYLQEMLPRRARYDRTKRAYDTLLPDGKAQDYQEFLYPFHQWFAVHSGSNIHIIGPQRREIARQAENQWAAMPASVDPPTNEAETFLLYNRWQAELRAHRLVNWSLITSAQEYDEYVAQYGAYIGYELADVYDLWTDDLYRVGMDTWRQLVPTFQKKCVDELLYRVSIELSVAGLKKGVGRLGSAFASSPSVTPGLGGLGPANTGPRYRDISKPGPAVGATPGASTLGDTAVKYVKDCLKGVVIDSIVNAIVSGAKQNWVGFRVNEGVYREVAEYWWHHFIMTTVKRDFPQESRRQLGNYARKWLKDRLKDSAVDARMESKVRAMAQRYLAGLPDAIATNPDIQLAARDHAARTPKTLMDAFRQQAKDEMSNVDIEHVKSDAEAFVQGIDVADFARKAIGEKLSVYWVNSSDWTRYGPDQIQRYKDIIECQKQKKEKVNPTSVLVYLRLAEDSYREFIRECRKKKDSEETAAAVRAKEQEEARGLLKEIDAILAGLPSQLGIYLGDLEADVQALDQAIDQKEADLVPFLDDPAVRCDPPSDAAAAFSARADSARGNVETVSRHRDQASLYRTQACDSLDRKVVEESARLAGHAAGEAGNVSVAVSATLAALIQEGEQTKPDAALRSFSVDDVIQAFSRVTDAMESRQPEFEAINAVDDDLTAKIQRGQWLTGRWYDTESRTLLRDFGERDNQRIKYINTRDDFHALIDILEAGREQIERAERDQQAALTCIATLYPLDELRQHAATLPEITAAAEASAREAEACLEGFDNHKIVELLRQCRLDEAEAALQEMDPNDPVYGVASGQVGREQSARRQLASAQKLWMDRDIGGDYRKYGAAYDILKGAQEPPAPCPDTRAALASALAEIERLLADADASSEPARIAKARGHIAECKLTQARAALEPDIAPGHLVWTEIAMREQGEAQARALYADVKATLKKGGDSEGRLGMLEQARATLDTAANLDLCDKTRAALARVIGQIDARIIQVRIAGARSHVAACRFDDARNMIAPIGEEHAEKQSILAAIEAERTVRADYAEARQRIAAPDTSGDVDALAAVRRQLAGLRDRAACDGTRDAIEQAIAAVDGAIENAGKEEKPPEPKDIDPVAVAADAESALQSCQWDQAQALIDRLDAAPGSQAQLRAQLEFERQAESFLVQAGDKGGSVERSAKLADIANRTRCESTRQTAASARESMLTALGEDAVTACDGDTARWAMGQLGSGPGRARIQALLDKENQARQALGTYRQAHESGDKSGARQAAIAVRDNAICRDTRSAAKDTVNDFNRTNWQAASTAAAQQGTGSGSGASGAGAATDPRCAAIQREMQGLSAESQRLAQEMQALAQSGNRDSIDRIRAIQSRIMAVPAVVQGLNGEFHQRGCDRAATRDTSQCHQWLDELNQVEQTMMAQQSSLMRCGNSVSCVTRGQAAMRDTVNRSQQLSTQFNAQCRK